MVGQVRCTECLNVEKIPLSGCHIFSEKPFCGGFSVFWLRGTCDLVQRCSKVSLCHFLHTVFTWRKNMPRRPAVSSWTLERKLFLLPTLENGKFPWNCWCYNPPLQTWLWMCSDQAFSLFFFFLKHDQHLKWKKFVMTELGSRFI